MTIGEGESHALKQSCDARGRERHGRDAWRDTGVPAGLRRVDITDARDDGLIEQHRLNRTTFAGELCTQQHRRERGILGFGAEAKVGRGIRRMPGDGAEGA